MSTQLTFKWADMPHPGRQEHDFFLLSDQWIHLRYRTLVKRGNVCECCGHSWSVGNPIQVDHIIPRSERPDLALNASNLQVLCRICNGGKGKWDKTDWRRTPANSNEARSAA